MAELESGAAKILGHSSVFFISRVLWPCQFSLFIKKKFLLGIHKWYPPEKVAMQESQTFFIENHIFIFYIREAVGTQ